MQVVINVPDNMPSDELKRRIEEFEQSLAHEINGDNKKGVLVEALNRLRARQTFKRIDDPVVWQKQLREDRDLPYR